MEQTHVPKIQYISTNLIPAKESKSLIWYLVYICFAYHYKVIICGFFGEVLGYDFLCHTMIHGVTTNHWFEQLVYAPVLWYALYKIIIIVFGPHENEVLSKGLKRLKTIAIFFLAMYIYGVGIHFTNTIEIYARTQLGIESGALYDQVYWVDEQLSHWIQFFFFFILIAWIIIFDRLDRIRSPYSAISIGLLHGLERTIGVIEGDNPSIAFVMGIVILVACLIRWDRHARNFHRAWKDFFFRYGLSFGISILISLFVYPRIFGGFVQPSAMGNKGWQVVLFVMVLAITCFLLIVLLDKILIRKKQL